MDLGYTCEQAADDAGDYGIALHVVKLPQTKCDFAWMARFNQLARDFGRLSKTVEGLHVAVFACIIVVRCLAESA